jgi:oligopeptide transport system substrate-binding protein
MSCVLRGSMSLVLLLLLLAAPVAAQEGTPTAVSTTATDHVLRIGRSFYPDTFDPQTTDYSFAVPSLVFEGLTRQDEQLNTVPAAAESWEFSDDGLTLTFHLRDGLTYSDGSPLTAERFRYAVERSCDARTAAPYVNFIFAIAGCEAFNTSLGTEEAGEGTPVATPGAEAVAAYEAARANLGVKARDDRTLEITLAHPAAYLPTVASTWLFYPIQQEIVETDPDMWWSDAANWVSNGPFAVSALAPDPPGRGVVTFVANEHYWGGRPKLNEIVYRYFGEDEVYDVEALAAYKRGELDMIYAPYPYGAQPEIADDPVLSQELLRYPLAATWLLSFNLKQEPFQDKQVREAFAYGFDREGFCRDVWLGACVPTVTFIPPGVPGHIDYDTYAYDPNAAKQALAASSYGGPENLPEIIYRFDAGDTEGQDLGEWLANNYKDSLGVDITLVPTTDEEWEALEEDGAFPQMDWWWWAGDYFDPQNWLSSVWDCDTGYLASQSGYCNPEFDALVEQADQESDHDARMALYEQAQRLVLDDAPAVFAYNDTQAMLVKPYVTGYVTTPRDGWPGWTSLLTIDVEPSAGGPAGGTPAQE